MRLPVYMDYQATTPVDPRVVEAMLPYFTDKFGNASSRQHHYGWIAEEAVERSRATIAKIVNAKPREIVFTSGATESNNLAVKGIAEAWKQKGNHIVTVQTEHKSVLDSCRRLEKMGYSVTYLPVDCYGVVDLNRLREAITSKTILVSVMFANNEIGTLQPIEDIGRICREREVFFHTDAVQAVGKIPLDVQASNVDLMSISGHKIYGPKGVGVLYVRSSDPKVKISAQIDGGGQEQGLRSGTHNVACIVGLAKALEISEQGMKEESSRLNMLRERLYTGLTTHLDDLYLNGHPIHRIPNNLNVSFLHVDNNVLMMSIKDVAVSTGSACSATDTEPSHVLKALHLPKERINSAIRFGLGRFTTAEEVEYVIDRFIESVNALRQNLQGYRKPQKVIVSNNTD